MVEDTLALDLDAFTEAVAVGEPPTQATVLRGEYDRAAVDDKLSALGIDSDESVTGTHWRSAPDNEIDLTCSPRWPAASATSSRPASWQPARQ
jgi:hypothetical protein